MDNAKTREAHKLALAIDPTSRGFGYALFEGPQVPLDWGTTEIRSGQDGRSLERAKKLIDHYRPEVLVLEDCSSEQGRRCPRVRTLLGRIEEHARQKQVPVARYPSSRIKEVCSFCDVRNKRQAALRICEWLPELARCLPPERKPWMSEDRRMGIFDAVALALTYYYLEE